MESVYRTNGPGMVFTILGLFCFERMERPYRIEEELFMTIGFMFFFNSVLLGVGLAMDAFSVSLANGLNEPQMKKSRMCGIAGVFAFFQALSVSLR